MQTNRKTILSIIIFALSFYGLTFINLLSPDKELSYSERRTLRQAPLFTMQNFSDGTFSDAFDRYVTDQFVFRIPFRYFKTKTNRLLLGKSDENGIFTENNHLFTIEYPYHPESTAGLCNTINDIINKYGGMSSPSSVNDTSLYFAIVPDKNYYLQGSSHLTLDYEQLEHDMMKSLPDVKYINLFNSLRLDDYYQTDSHWRQECLEQVVLTLHHAMNDNAANHNLKNNGSSVYGDDNSQINFSISDFEQHPYSPFYGVYYGQSASLGEADTLIYLTNETTNQAIVEHVEYGKPNRMDLPVYDTEKLGEMDSYDVFLSGASAVITLTNESSHSQKELVLFRDSFGSSLAPLLLEEYKSITLIDLRYLSSSLFDEYINLEGKDVLFLYSTTIINNSSVITSS